MIRTKPSCDLIFAKNIRWNLFMIFHITIIILSVSLLELVSGNVRRNDSSLVDPLKWQISKVGCILPMVVVSVLPKGNSDEMTIGKAHST